MNKLGRIGLVLVNIIPLILVLCIPAESLKEGLFSHSIGCILSLIALPIAQYIMLFKSSFKDDGWKVMYVYGILIALFLSIATWLA